MSDLVERADAFATAAHASVNQRRKYTLEPYIVHPRAVMALVQGVPHDDAMLAAALLHDVLEDVAPTRPEYGRDAIRDAFGADVLDLVSWLTDVSLPGDRSAPRDVRTRLNREHSARSPARAQTIKMADVVDNSRSILTCDADFARVWTREKELLLDALPLADPTLRRMALNQLADYTGIIH